MRKTAEPIPGRARQLLSKKKRQMVDPNVGKENINVLSVLPAEMNKKKKRFPDPQLHWFKLFPPNARASND